jgi:ATP-binding cassette, subfamily B, bacterial PglK
MTRWRCWNAIELRHIGFRYPGTAAMVLEDVNLLITKGARIGIVGASGAGKSTLVDLMLGLIPPSSGELLIDGVALGAARLSQWQQQLAHVPQALFVADASLAENIALSVAGEAIDMSRAQRAAEQARLDVPLDALVGERGVRLSGGQRQRLGIARALYKRAAVLILDEATNALDAATEQEVLAAVEDIGPELTVIVISHHARALRMCQLVYELHAGRLTARG